MSSTSLHSAESEVSKELLDKTFESLLDQINTDHLLLETNTLAPESKKFYENLAIRNYDAIHLQTKKMANLHFMRRILEDYLNGISKINSKRLALAFSDHTLYSWVEISEDDIDAENNLWRLEAQINASFFGKGMHLSTTVVEPSDNLPIPSNYKTVEIKE